MTDQSPPTLPLTPRCYLCGCHLLAIESQEQEKESAIVKCGRCKSYLGRAEDLVAGIHDE